MYFIIDDDGSEEEEIIHQLVNTVFKSDLSIAIIASSYRDGLTLEIQHQNL